MSIGIRTFFRKSANQTVTASVTLVDCTGLIVPVAALEIVTIRLFLPFTLGASGGFKFQITVPAGGTSFLNSYVVTDGVTATPGAIIAATQTSSAAFANALAVAGTHQLEADIDIVNGTTAGNIALQFACNSAAGAIIALAGGKMDVVKL
jgi:hypothetical protein